MTKTSVAVYCGSHFGVHPEYKYDAQAFGTWLGAHNYDMVYGGSSVGLMGLVSRAAMDAGARVVGVEPQFFIDQGVAQHDLDELIVVDTIGERKAAMIEHADAFVALPGGVGTLEEISEIMVRVHLRISKENRIDPGLLAHCFLLNANGFFDGLKLQLETMLHKGFMLKETFERIHFCDSLEELCEDLLKYNPPEQKEKKNGK